MADCGLTNLGSCLPEAIFKYIAGLINEPLQYLLNLIKSLMVEPVDVSLFSHYWAVVIYILSMFYGLLIVYVGFNFMLSGHNIVKREEAKEWLRNVIIMIVLVQASFFLYEIIISIGSLLTSGIMSMIDQQFFLLSGENFNSFSLELIFCLLYLVVLLITLIMLVMRYIFIGIGVVFFPIAIFFYFIPPLRGYGKFILNILGILIFLSFFQALILLGSSMIMDVPIFHNLKILVMICAFSLVNLFFLVLILFAKNIANDLPVTKNLTAIASTIARLG